MSSLNSPSSPLFFFGRSIHELVHPHPKSILRLIMMAATLLLSFATFVAITVMATAPLPTAPCKKYNIGCIDVDAEAKPSAAFEWKSLVRDAKQAGIFESSIQGCVCQSSDRTHQGRSFIYIEPGSPEEQRFIESCGARFTAKCSIQSFAKRQEFCDTIPGYESSNS